MDRNGASVEHCFFPSEKYFFVSVCLSYLLTSGSYFLLVTGPSGKLIAFCGPSYFFIPNWILSGNNPKHLYIFI